MFRLSRLPRAAPAPAARRAAWRAAYDRLAEAQGLPSYAGFGRLAGWEVARELRHLRPAHAVKASDCYVHRREGLCDEAWTVAIRAAPFSGRDLNLWRCCYNSLYDMWGELRESTRAVPGSALLACYRAGARASKVGECIADAMREAASASLP